MTTKTTSTLLNVLSQGTKGTPTAQTLVGLQAVQAQLQACRYTHIAAEHLRERIAALPNLGPEPKANVVKQGEASGPKKPASPKKSTRKRTRSTGPMVP